MSHPAISRTRLQVTQLEDRCTPAGGFLRGPQVLFDATGQLAIIGTPRADLVRVRQEGAALVVQVVGRRGGEYRFDAGPVRQIVFSGGAGNDAFLNDTAVVSTLDGGSGRDTLQGGDGPDVLLGGAANDLLHGQGGDDLLHGGPGRNCCNQMLGEDGVDTIVSLSPRDLIDLGPQTEPPPVASEPPFAVDQIAADIVRLTNSFRVDSRLRVLTLDARLTQAAQAHAEALANRGVLSHDLNSKGPGDRAAAVLYPSGYIGENIARMLNQSDPASATVTGWQSSPSHRANLLNGRYRAVGAGVARGADGWIYLVQLLGG